MTISNGTRRKFTYPDPTPGRRTSTKAKRSKGRTRVAKPRTTAQRATSAVSQ